MVVFDAPGAKVGIVLGNSGNVKMKLDFLIGEIVLPLANQVVFVVVEVDGLIVIEQGGDVVAIDVGACDGGVQTLDLCGVGKEDFSKEE